MSAIARFFFEGGMKVCGYDKTSTALTKELEKMGMAVHYEENVDRIPEKADLVGADHRAIQAAVDYVAGLGGGTVQILPGKYRFRNAVQLVDKFGLLASQQPDLAQRRRALADELHRITRRLDTLRRIAQASGQPVLTERAPRPQGGSHG